MCEIVSASHDEFIRHFDEAQAKILTGTPSIRERGLEDIVYLLKEYQGNKKNVLEYMKTCVMQMVLHADRVYRKMGFQTIGAMVEHRYFDNYDPVLQDAVSNCLEDSDLTVRHAVADLLDVMTRAYGPVVWERFKHSLLLIIEKNLERPEEAVIRTDTGNLVHLYLHDTQGYKALESAVRSIKNIARALGPKFSSQISYPFLNLVNKLLCHQNRFVRETAFGILEVSFESVMTDEQILEYTSRAAEFLSLGLVDPWGHVVLATSRAMSALGLKLSSLAKKEYETQFKKSVSDGTILTTLDQDCIARGAREMLHVFLQNCLPYAYFNRHSPATGICNQSRRVWSILTHSQGRQLVSTYIRETVDTLFFLMQSDVDTQREMACRAVQELFEGFSQDTHDPAYLILQTRLTEFWKLFEPLLTDRSWAVREDACHASQYIFSYLTKTQIEKLYQILLERNVDSFSSIREAAAASLSKLVLAHPSYLPLLVDRLNALLPSILSQPDDLHIVPSVESSFGPITKRAHDNDPSVHVNQACFLCEHTSPSDPSEHSVRPPEPWEKTHGAIYLISALYRQWNDQVTLSAHLSELASILSRFKRNFSRVDLFMSTTWQQLHSLFRHRISADLPMGQIESDAWALFISALDSSDERCYSSSLTTVSVRSFLNHLRDTLSND
ncbi:uncharacterized protein LOC126317111 isoform X1 [Schistocerca gregaria]|uniref:uncharacterized protein LOC126317111 isoform X1 n=1 Tax=Schistocerca gregaria TaxID=7010 RepID=UPI00211F10C0|nr:uncharacterized protein LOC126317111 isoform X1 [Schistocerca gregaria]